jgi:hypothetical protein
LVIAESRRGPAGEDPDARRAEREVAQQAVEAEGGEEAERRVDLGLPRLPHELEGQQQ